MGIKNRIIGLFMIMVLCLSVVPALATEPLNAMPQFTIAVGDTAPASDVMLATNIISKLRDAGYDTSAVGAVKLFSEVNGQMLDNKVTLVIYEGGAIIIVGATSPASHAMFAVSLTAILQVQGTSLDTVLSSEVPSTDLIDLFEEPVPVPVCMDTDGGRNEFIRGTTTGTTACTVQENCNTAISSTDFCNGNILNEFVCDIDSRYNVERRYVNFIECEYGCSNGACLREPQETNCKVLVNGEVIRNVYATNRNDCYSKTSFGSRNCVVYNSYFRAGRNILEQYYDETDRVNSDVCYAMEEVEEVPVCMDTDGGKNVYNKGTATGKSVFPDEGYTSKTDYCIQKTQYGIFELDQNLRDPYLAGQVRTCTENCAVHEYYCSGETIVADVTNCPSGCSDGVCISRPEEDVEKHQMIAGIDGNKGVYAPGEKISLRIKGIETNDGSPAENSEGWNVQYYTYDTTNTDNYMQEYVPTGNYNAQFDGRYWYANYWAPKDEGRYYTEVVLYCSRDGSDCRAKYDGDHGYEAREKVYFKVDEDAMPSEGEEKPDLVIRNARYVKHESGLATIDFDIYNIGQAPAEDWFAIAVYIDGRIQTHTVYKEQRPGTSYTRDANAVVALMPGDKHHKSISNYNWLTSGNLKRTVTLVVDRFEGSEEENPVYEGFRDNMIDESNEENNKVELRVGQRYEEVVPYLANTFWINDWRKTEKLVDGRQHVFAVSDINLEREKCSVYVDGATGWVTEGDTEVINGIKLRLEDVEMAVSTDGGRYEIRQCRITVYGSAEEAIEIVEEAVVVPEYGITPINGDGECEGCTIANSCIGQGIRFLRDEAPSFCDIGGKIREQKEDDDACQNDYECLSNTCGNGECQDFGERLEALEEEMKETRGIVNRILNWLKRWFGGGSDDVVDDNSADGSTGDDDSGHGNDDDLVDEDNPGNSGGSNAGGNGNGNQGNGNS